MAGCKGSGPRQACDGADPSDAGRQGLRQPVEHPHEGNRTLCGDDETPLSSGGKETGIEPGTPAACYQQLPAPAPDWRSAIPPLMMGHAPLHLRVAALEDHGWSDLRRG